MNFKIEFENGGCEKRKRCPRVGFPGNRPRVRDGGEVRILCFLGHHAWTFRKTFHSSEISSARFSPETLRKNDGRRF